MNLQYCVRIIRCNDNFHVECVEGQQVQDGSFKSEVLGRCCYSRVVHCCLVVFIADCVLHASIPPTDACMSFFSEQQVLKERVVPSLGRWQRPEEVVSEAVNPVIWRQQTVEAVGPRINGSLA